MKLRRRTMKDVYILSVFGTTPMPYRQCRISLSENFFIRNAVLLRIGLVLSQSLVVSRFTPLVAPLSSIVYAFHRNHAEIISTIVRLDYYFQRTLIKATPCSLGVSMSYFSGGRFKMNGRQWETSEQSGVAPFKGGDDRIDGERHNSYQLKWKPQFHRRVSERYYTGLLHAGFKKC